MELLKSIFSGVLTMSLKAIPVILLVLLLRFALRRAPKRWAYALWAVPLYRLVCPAALPAAFSLYNLSFLPRSTRSGGVTGTAADFFNLQGTSQAVSPPPGTLAGVQTSPAASAAPAASNTVTAAEHAATQAASSGTAAAAAQTAIPHSVDWLTVATIVWLAGLALLLAGLTCCTDAAPKTLTGQIRETEQSVADRTEQLTDDITLSYDYELPGSTQSVALAVKGTGLFESELVTLWSGAANELTGSLALTNLSNDFDVSIQLTHDDNYENTFEFNGAGSLYTPSHTKLVPNRSDAITLTQDSPSLLFTAAVEGAGSPIGTYEFYLYPASTAADCIPFLPEIGDLPQRLYDARTDYLGDASAVVNLLNMITTSRNTAHDAFCTGSSMELHTDAEPYGMVVNASIKDLNLLGGTATNRLIREQFRTGALMLALVGNLDRYYEQFDQVSGLELSNLTVETAEQVLGIDDLKSFGQSADGVAQLLGLIDLALNNSDWLNSSALLMEPLGTFSPGNATIDTDI